MTTKRSPPAWTLDGHRARRDGVTVDLTRPRAGLALAATGDSVLGLELRPEAADAVEPRDRWLRGDDLVAVYEPEDQRQLRATAMWRGLGGPSPVWEVVVSSQTSLLESDCRIAVVSDVGVGDVAWGRRSQGSDILWTVWEPGLDREASHRCPEEAECLFVRRDRDAVLLAVHPADRRRIEIAVHGDRLEILCWLFSEASEKGVLFRSRVRAAIGPATRRDWAEQIVRALAAEPPPLDT